MFPIQVRMCKHPHVLSHPITTPTFFSSIASFIDGCIEQLTAVNLNREAFAAVHNKGNEVISEKLHFE